MISDGSRPVLCLGELLFDRLGSEDLPGGAPANVACHVAALAGASSLISRVGDDAGGETLARWLRSRNVSTALLQKDRDLPTGAVRVFPGPRYEIPVPVAWDAIEPSDHAISAATGAGALVFGTLAQRHPVSRGTIRALVVSARAAGVPVLCDLNLREPFYDTETVLWSLRNCDVLKLNVAECAVVSQMLGARGKTEDLFAGLLREFAISRGVLTDGQNGAWLCEGGELHRTAAANTSVCDAVGAGDALTAVVAVAVVRGMPLRGAMAPAAALAAFVVSCRGATPELPPALASRINSMLGA